MVLTAVRNRIVDLVLQVLIDVGQNAQVVLGAQMLALGLQQVQVVLQRLFLQRLRLGGGGGEALGGRAEADVHAVHIADQIHDLRCGHIVGEPAAEGGGEVELAVREGSGAAEAAHGIADGTVDAPVHLAGDDGTLAAVDVRALIHHQHIQLGAELLELVTGKDAGLAAANDRNIITGVHQFDSILQYSFGGALETS